jgi:hypothetical protein
MTYPVQWDRDRHIRVFEAELRDAEFEAAFASASNIKFAKDVSPFPVSEAVNRVAAEGPGQLPDDRKGPSGE